MNNVDETEHAMDKMSNALNEENTINDLFTYTCQLCNKSFLSVEECTEPICEQCREDYGIPIDYIIQKNSAAKDALSTINEDSKDKNYPISDEELISWYSYGEDAIKSDDNDTKENVSPNVPAINYKLVLASICAIISCIWYYSVGGESYMPVIIIIGLFIFALFFYPNTVLKNGRLIPTKSKNKDKTYERISSSHETDNMNCLLYKFSGKYIETDRMRTNKEIYIFEGDEPLQEIKKLGYTEPIKFEKIMFPRPSDNQINYLNDLSNNHHRTEICKYDASALIDHYVNEDDKIPNPALFRYAEEMRIPVSYYCGKKRLYDEIFYNLTTRDRIAFFAFQVYRYHYKNYDYANLNNSPHRYTFYRFADLVLLQENQRFIKSMNKYSGESLRTFADEYNGGSRNTLAYKATINFLKKEI